MKRILIFLSFISVFNDYYSQTIYDYSNGYRAGFQKACNCNESIPLRASMETYSQGYEAGYIDGRIHYNNNNNKQNQQSDLYTPDYSLIYYALKAKQDRYDEQIKANQSQKEEALRLEREKTKSLMSQVSSYYNSFNNYPTIVKDGWHKVWVMDNINYFCGERKVYVQNQKVTKYLQDDFVYRPIKTTLPIVKGKIFGELTLGSGSIGNVEIFFLEYIADPNSSCLAPSSSGKYTFYLDCEGAYSTDNNTVININGLWVGNILNKCFSNGNSPECGYVSDGSATIELAVGTYDFKAFNSNNSWTGSITITENGCSSKRFLSK